MGNLTDAQKQAVIDALVKHGATKPCPRCDNQKFTLLDGYFNPSITPESGGSMGKEVVPSILTVCTRCGYLSIHALGALGLVEKSKK
jgi:hypothetical protein